MINNQVKELFQFQNEILDMKVDMAVSKAIDRVVDQMRVMNTEMYAFRHEVNSEFYKLRHDMHTQITNLSVKMSSEFASLDKRVVSIETELGLVGEKKKGFYNHALDYVFKAGYTILTMISGYIAYILYQLHNLIK